MSFQKKYWYTFKDLINTEFKVEILQDITGTTTAEEIRGDANPFSIEYSTVTKFETVRGSGCELNLLSTTDRKFFGLYTANMFEYQIRVYEGSNLIWLGYLDSELYSEPFNEIKNYPVKFSGTDGFALLERLNYLDVNGNKYTGIDTQFNVIKNILLKLNLAWNNIYISLSTTSDNFVIASGETIFHKTYTNNQNWYNEDGDAETCRKVLEEILKPYSCFIIQDRASLYIIDVNTLAKNTTTTFKKYNSSFVYVSDENINLNLGDLTTIKFAASNQQLNVVSGFNKQVVKYSPYINSKLIDFNASNDFSSLNSSGTYGSEPYQWTENIYSNSESWTASNNGRFAELSTTKDNDTYLKILKYGNTVGGVSPSTLSFTYKKELPNFIPSNCKIRINAKGYVRTLDDYDNPNASTENISMLTFRTKLTVGNKQYYHQMTDAKVFGMTTFTSGWADSTDNTKYLELTFENGTITKKNTTYLMNYQPIDNNWIDLKISSVTQNGGKDTSFELFVPLNDSSISGNMSFEIYDFDITPTGDKDHDTIKSTIKDVRIKDIELTVVDAEGNEIKNEDVEYIGYMNSNFKNEGDLITVYQGSSKILNSIEKGALIYNNNGYKFINDWTREGKTDLIENLLLRSIVSNYTNKTIQLSCTTNKISSILGCLTYQNFLPDKVFMIVSAKQNLDENTTDLTLQEISIDNLDVNKVY